MTLYKLTRDYFDGTQKHDAGTVLDFPEGSRPPSTAERYTGRPQPAGTVGVAPSAAPTPSVAPGSPPPPHPEVSPPTNELMRPQGVSQDEPGTFQPGKEPIVAPGFEEQGPIRGPDEGVTTPSSTPVLEEAAGKLRQLDKDVAEPLEDEPEETEVVGEVVRAGGTKATPSQDAAAAEEARAADKNAAPDVDELFSSSKAPKKK